ncbi:MAG TPA: site-specific DNA-methyltransferase, partial [Candidatus Pacearchaeota archaeon]|nr:site-specific DNA-methyltransferase [Candidatus Pacearchaeota archaeon]
ELKILSLFDDLDNSLDGWLIKSENYQALNTILPKFKEKVQTIYIDPPFNKEQDADYHYNVKYKNSSWATLLENRLPLAKECLNEKGSIFVRCDYNGNWIVRCLMDEIFGEENFRNEIIINRTPRLKNEGRKYYTSCDSLFLYSKNSEYIFEQQRVEEPFEIELKMKEGIDQEEVKKFLENVFEDIEFEIKGNKLKARAQKWIEMHASSNKINNEPITVFGKVVYPPKKRRWMWKDPENIKKMEEMGWIRINPHNNLPELLRTWRYLGSDWTDIKAYSQTTGFKTENSEELLQRVINTGSQKKGFVLDFFLGSGTTTAVAHKLGRRWIGVEMGEHFYTVVLPRMKKV